MRFAKTKVESQIVGKAKAKNYLRREVKLEGQIVNKAKVKNYPRKEICSKLTGVSNKRQLDLLNFEGKQLLF